ncbi:unnamed protein product [Blepharisma stoltei]|uniref:Kinesin-like protein n=1 Tax=Blepharisma stoltei TaxID=1481888 RepID=A0AAU9JII9_9CILI|nr:unnamed protein product [Blepharisma stoltei]
MRRNAIRSKTMMADPDFAAHVRAGMSRQNNIKVISRFRPLIDFEMTDEDQSPTDNHALVNFLSENTIAAGPGFETFTLDHVFDPDSKQSEVYEIVGKPVIEDVLNGYNGTIFAYGQTGSGKTHTMMGKNIFEEEYKGIIPRAAQQIFEAVQSDYGEIEYTLKCSMLEIYKETLRDLLVAESVKLKIKECPRRGIHVQGLTEVCVTNENDMIEVLTIGQQMRTVATTKLNKASSRSHLLFTLEVIQKLPNDSEKKGKLNLVDLAGSEKVSHSGVTGNNLEETKKINLSLSALGNVIHALISYSDHIPYRDSKLTRLLQESLGGNYKTTLIVACSPSARAIEETLNTLKFAVRAKKIKNKATINIKNSPESYIKMIEKLKAELAEARREINLLRSERDFAGESRSVASLSPILKDPPLPGLLHSNTITLAELASPKNYIDSSRVSTYEDSQLDLKRSPFSTFEPDYLTTSFQLKPFDSSFPSSPDPEAIKFNNEAFEKKIRKYKKKTKFLKRENTDLREKVAELEAKVTSTKTKQLQNEQKAHEFYEKYNKVVLGNNKENNTLKLIQEENEKLVLQVSKFTKALDSLNIKYKDVNEKLINSHQITEVEFDDLTEVSILQLTTPVMGEQELSELEACRTENLEVITNSLSINPRDLSRISDPYTDEIKKAVENNDELNRDISIFHLKNQLIHASMINSNLVRGIHALDWKFRLLADKYSLKKMLVSHQKEQIDSLEKMIDFLHDSHMHMLKLYEQVNPEKPNLSKKDLVLIPKAQMLKSFTPSAVAKRRRLSTTKLIDSCESTRENSKSKDDLDCYSMDTFSFQLKYSNLETSLELQRLYNNELKRTNEFLKEQSETYQKMLNNFEKDVFKAQKEERERWRKFFIELKENCEKELLRKQSEVVRLNTLLGKWADQYMELQESLSFSSKPFSQSSYEEMKKLIKDTITNSYTSPTPSLKEVFRKSPLKRSFSSYPAPYVKPHGDINPI